MDRSLNIPDSRADPWAAWLRSGLLEAISGAVIVTDLLGKILFVNGAAERLSGYETGQNARPQNSGCAGSAGRCGRG